MDKKPSVSHRVSRHGLPCVARSPAAHVQHKRIGQILRNNTIQAKLSIGQPNDKYEQEADRVAEQVMSMPEPKAQCQQVSRNNISKDRTGPQRSIATPEVQRMCPECEEELQREPIEEEEALQTKSLAKQITPLLQRQPDPEEDEEAEPEKEEEEEPIQTKLIANTVAPQIQRWPKEEEEKRVRTRITPTGFSLQYAVPAGKKILLQTRQDDEADAGLSSGVEAAVQRLPGTGNPLSAPVRSFMEPRFNADFSAVRIHTEAGDLARAVKAQAFTFGRDIVFGGGDYAPESERGRRLLAHELTHVVQQGMSGYPRLQRHNNADTRLPADEPEALAFATAADAEIRAALTRLATATNLLHRNVPALVSQEGITLLPLTPRHDNTPGAGTLRFFPGFNNYVGSVNLPEVATHRISTNSKTVSIRVREHADIDNMLFPFEVDDRVAIAVLEAAERLATRSSASALTIFERYRARFNAIAETSRVMFLLDEFDPTLDSHGPRFSEARRIFDEIYASDPSFHNAYDANSGGIKERVDSYTGPDSLNPIASPRLQRLRAAFFPFATPVTALATYNSLRTNVQAVSATLAAEDRAVVDASNIWQRLINDHVTTDARRSELRDIIRTPPAAPAPAPVAPTPAPAAPAPAGGAVTPQGFVDSVSLTGPGAPLPSIGHEVSTTLSPVSTLANPGVAISSQITVTPGNQVSGNNVSPASPWPNSATAGTDFSPQLLVSTGAAFGAQLALVNGPAGLAPTNPIPPLHFTLDDRRLTNFASAWTPELQFFDISGTSVAFQPGASSVRYMSGGQNLNALAAITAPPGSNPGLTLTFEARVDRAGTVVAPAQQTPFPANASRTARVALNVSQPPGGVPLGTTDPLDVEMRLLDSTGTLVAGSARTQRINVGPEATYTQAQAQTSWNDDEDFFHNDTPNLLDIMSANGGTQARFADAVRPPAGHTPLLTFHPLVVRDDSAAFVAQSNMVGGVPTPDPSRTAYFVLSPYGPHPDTAHSFIDVAGAAGFNIPSFPGIPGRLIVVNRTADPSTNTKDPTDITITLTLHEATHALDEIFGPATDIERYRTEFRAYWMDGRHGPPNQAIVPGHPDQDARYDPSMPPPGPKSPRARTIFNEELYGSVTYPWVQGNYDNNVNHFRELVDAYTAPDGINLILSRRLEALRVLINGGVTPNFNTFRNRVRAFFGAGPAPAPSVGILDLVGERDYISSSRAWRDLVDARVSGVVNRRTIKNDMGIPL